jgi:hypothetical protein
MAKIAGLDDTKYGNVTGQGNVQWTDLGKQSLIYKLMQNAKNFRVPDSVAKESLTYFVPAYFSNMYRTDLWNVGGWLNAVVAIYQVKY